MADPITVGVGNGCIRGGRDHRWHWCQEDRPSQRRSYRYKAGVALLNKQINEQNASWATQAGGAKAQVEGMKSREAIASTKVVRPPPVLTFNSGRKGMRVGSGPNSRRSDHQHSRSRPLLVFGSDRAFRFPSEENLAVFGWIILKEGLLVWTRWFVICLSLPLRSLGSLRG